MKLKYIYHENRYTGNKIFPFKIIRGDELIHYNFNSGKWLVVGNNFFNYGKEITKEEFILECLTNGVFLDALP